MHKQYFVEHSSSGWKIGSWPVVKLPNGSLILFCQKRTNLRSSKLLDLDVCSNDNKSFMAEVFDNILWSV